MKALILGGSQFIGRHVTDAILKNTGGRANITHANRGKTKPDGIPGVSHLRFDRSNENPDELKGLQQDWDIVVDLSAYYPRQVEFVLDGLKGRIGRYVFCSTISVYRESLGSTHPKKSSVWMTETSELLPCSPEQAVDTSMMTYGNKKAECERVILKRTHQAATIIRPSVVYGAHDPTDRFAYWIARAAGKSRYLLPENGITITQKTYGPDLGQAFWLAATTSKAVGQAYNIADQEPLSLRDSLKVMGSLDNAVSVSTESLESHGVRPWMDLPLWIPSTHFLVDTFQARSDLGFSSTPSDLAAQAACDAFLAEARAPKTGLSLEAEIEILRKLHI